MSAPSEAEEETPGAQFAQAVLASRTPAGLGGGGLASSPNGGNRDMGGLRPPPGGNGAVHRVLLKKVPSSPTGMGMRGRGLAGVAAGGPGNNDVDGASHGAGGSPGRLRSVVSTANMGALQRAHVRPGFTLGGESNALHGGAAGRHRRQSGPTSIGDTALHGGADGGTITGTHEGLRPRSRSTTGAAWGVGAGGTGRSAGSIASGSRDGADSRGGYGSPLTTGSPTDTQGMTSMGRYGGGGGGGGVPRDGDGSVAGNTSTGGMTRRPFRNAAL